MQKPWQMSYTVATLLVVAVALAGCPKRPAMAPAAVSAPAPPAAQPAAPAPPAPSAPPPAAAPVTPPAPAETPPAPAAPSPVVAAPAVPAPQEFAPIAALSDIHFDFDKYAIRPGDRKILEQNAGWLKANPTALVLVEGHCDERGTVEYNLALGERRAKATRDYLVSLGIAGARISTISYGKERPVCTERTEACWAQNRRAHFLVKLGSP